MTLVLEIEYLAGVSFAAIHPDNPASDWPPKADRVFSALVASWAARGEQKEEAQALKWLEQLPPPRVVESGAEPRTSVTTFVPPNDPRLGRQKHARGVLPALRTRQPRRFHAARLNEPVVQLCWQDVVPESETLAALGLLARDTAYVGHSSSLTRCRFLLSAEGTVGNGKATARRVYPGRFNELREAYARFEKSADKKDRPERGPSFTFQAETIAVEVSSFGRDWLILEHTGGVMPDLRACALVARAIRDTILSGYRQVGLGERIPELVSGHSAVGVPSRLPHIAIVPLAFVGFTHSDGHVLGFAIVPPRASAILGDADFRKALRQRSPVNEQQGRRVMTVKTKEGTERDSAFSIGLSPSFEAGRQSLDPGPYDGPSRTFATVTPIVLDRHLKSKGEARQEEIAEQVAAACTTLGLPRPQVVVPDKHSAIEGAPSAFPSSRSPNWMRWRAPAAMASRQLTHAVIRFEEPVEGPIILGAGRYLGLGLCRSLDVKESP